MSTSGEYNNNNNNNNNSGSDNEGGGVGGVGGIAEARARLGKPLNMIKSKTNPLPRQMRRR